MFLFLVCFESSIFISHWVEGSIIFDILFKSNHYEVYIYKIINNNEISYTSTNVLFIWYFFENKKSLLLDNIYRNYAYIYIYIIKDRFNYIR